MCGKQDAKDSFWILANEHNFPLAQGYAALLMYDSCITQKIFRYPPLLPQNISAHGELSKDEINEKVKEYGST